MLYVKVQFQTIFFFSNGLIDHKDKNPEFKDSQIIDKGIATITIPLLYQG